MNNMVKAQLNVWQEYEANLIRIGQDKDIVEYISRGLGIEYRCRS